MYQASQQVESHAHACNSDKMLPLEQQGWQAQAEAGGSGPRELLSSTRRAMPATSTAVINDIMATREPFRNLKALAPK